MHVYIGYNILQPITFFYVSVYCKCKKSVKYDIKQ